MYLKSFERSNHSRKRLDERETVLIKETVLISIMFLKLALYWSYNRDISKKFQTVPIIETVLIIET